MGVLDIASVSGDGGGRGGAGKEQALSPIGQRLAEVNRLSNEGRMSAAEKKKIKERIIAQAVETRGSGGGGGGVSGGGAAGGASGGGGAGGAGGGGKRRQWDRKPRQSIGKYLAEETPRGPETTPRRESPADRGDRRGDGSGGRGGNGGGGGGGGGGPRSGGRPPRDEREEHRGERNDRVMSDDFGPGLDGKDGTPGRGGGKGSRELHTTSPAEKDIAMLHQSLGRARGESGGSGGRGDDGDPASYDGGGSSKELQTLHQTVSALVEEEEKLLEAHMMFIQLNADMLGEQGELLAKVQGEDVVDYDIDAYAKRLDELLTMKQQFITRLQRQLHVFRKVRGAGRRVARAGWEVGEKCVWGGGGYN
jgi:hypothetical protein